MNTQQAHWQYIAAYKEEVAALIQQQLEELHQSQNKFPANQPKTGRLILYTGSILELRLAQHIAARA